MSGANETSSIGTNTVSSQNESEREQHAYWNERFSVAFHLFLPVAGLGFLLFGRKYIIPQLLVQIDRNCVSVLFPSLSKREKLLKWARQRLPSKWSSQSSKTLSGGVTDLWSDGSLLCTLINTAIPGACPNPHRHWKQPPSHAQAIAYKYLGIVPIFSEEDLAGNLTSNFERAFISYSCEIQKSINKINENIDVKRTFCSEYIARGLGLFSGEQYQKTFFYVYPDDFENSEPSNNSIIINIKGPFSTYGHATISKIHNSPSKTLDEKSNNSNHEDRRSKFMKTFSWFMKRPRKLDESNENIEIDITMEKNRAKVTYIPNNYGMHEINLICNGELLKGCPYNVHIFSNNTKNGYNLEKEEKIEGLRHYQKRKILSEMVDLIDEKIPLSVIEEKYQVTETNQIEKKDILNSSGVVEDITNENDILTEKCTREKMDDSNIQHSTDIDDENGITYDRIIEMTDSHENMEFPDSIDFIPQVEAIDKPDSSINHDVEKGDHFEDGAESEKIDDSSQTWEPNYNVEIQMPIIDEVDETLEVIKNFNEGVMMSEFPLQRKKYTGIESEKEHRLQKNVSRQTYQDLTLNVNNFNSDNLSKPTVITSDNLAENKQENDLMFADNILDIGHRVNVHDETSNRQRVPKYNIINKIKIPSKFLEHETSKVVINAANTKYFPTSNGQSTMTINDRCRTDDLNNNNLYINETKMEQHFGAFNQNNINGEGVSFAYQIQDQEHHNDDTSTICSKHIVDEVKYSQISVAEKRKIFLQSSSKSIPGLKNSSFSVDENVEGSINKRYHQTEGLSVLNVLDSLKKSVKISNDEHFSLSSTISLPNISFESGYTSSNEVKEKKTFWEKMYMSSSISPRSLSPKITKKDGLIEGNRNRSLWKKSDELKSTKKRQLERDLYHKSADDILAMTESLSHQYSRDFKSVDDCSDKYEMLTIEERKQMLLKQNYTKEKLAREDMFLKNRICKKNYQFQKYFKPSTDEEQKTLRIPSIIEKIRKFDGATSLSIGKEKYHGNIEPTTYRYNDDSKYTSPESSVKEVNDSRNDSIPKPKVRYRSQFNRAIKYFKKLEEKSQGKPKSKISKKSKQCTLDIHPKTDRPRMRGGSLNISERFSIDNLYEDITKNRRGSLKGTPNRTALVEALATFSRREDHFFYFCGNEDDIKYDIFKNLGRTKKRKSLRSIFDVYY